MCATMDTPGRLSFLTCLIIIGSLIPITDADCPSVPTTNNGNSNVFKAATKLTAGGVITYKCITSTQAVSGTTASPTYTHTCDGTNWEAAVPSVCNVIKCLTAPTQANTNALTVTVPASTGTEVTFTCKSGYVVATGDTDIIMICKKDSVTTYKAIWALQANEPAGANCHSSTATCSATAPTENNAVAGTPTGTASGSTITYTCNTDFQVVSGTTATQTFTRTCTSGAWASASPAGCTAVKCLTAPPTDANAQASPTVTSPVAVGSAAITYTCTGSNLVNGQTGKTTYTYTCIKSNAYQAAWVSNPASAKCTATCSATAPAENNAVAGTPTGTASGSTITYTCNTDFQVVSGTTATQTFTRTCTSGAWASASPAGCTAVKCLIAPPTDANAQASPTVTPPVAVGSAAITYTCTDSNLVNGQTGKTTYTYTCTKSNAYQAAWVSNPASAKCTVAQACSSTAPAGVGATAGTVPGTITTGSVITYTCLNGKQVVVGTTAKQTYKLTCAASGWGNPDPASCTDIMCLVAAPVVTHATKTTPANSGLQSIVEYTCDATYYWETGKNTWSRVCTKTSLFEAAWQLAAGIPANVQCKAPTCGALPAIKNAATKETGTSYPVGTSATYTCNSGWVAVIGTESNTDTFTSTCTTTNLVTAWKTSGTCTALTCAALPTITLGSTSPATGGPFPYNTQITVTCDSGYGITNELNTYKAVCAEDPTTHLSWWNDVKSKKCSNINECTSTAFKSTCVAPNTCVDATPSFTCTCAPGYTQAADKKSCTDINECAANTNLCGTGYCVNNPGSYTCPCKNNVYKSGGTNFIVFIVNLIYNKKYSAKTAAQQTQWKTAMTTLLTNTYTSLTDFSKCGICSIVDGSVVVQHVVTFTKMKTDAELAVLANSAKDAINTAGTFTVLGEDFPIDQPLRLSIDSGKREVPVISTCSYYDAHSLCKNGGVCDSSISKCKCPDWSLGTYCETKVGLSPLEKGMIALGVILFILICGLIICACLYYFYKKRQTANEAEQLMDPYGGSPPWNTGGPQRPFGDPNYTHGPPRAPGGGFPPDMRQIPRPLTNNSKYHDHIDRSINAPRYNKDYYSPRPQNHYMTGQMR